ncbi:MAG: hypothetical protein F6K09_04215 [Merismopedia sp. SIO2A8]|nr:hypothetical protein [Symploca sp. SIO2B6]NET47929.1 hypothetical protein [Merismopedia sp. SIO2A8]
MNDTFRKTAGGDDFSEYVAHLQLHMALQARNLVPRMNSKSISNSRDQLLQATQADFEKIASRQLHSSNV